MATERVHQDPSLRTAGELLAELDVEPALGLSAEQAGARLARYGPNELRTALLRAVSHDLRTPIATMKASVTSLLQDDVRWSEHSIYEVIYVEPYGSC